MRFHFSFLLGLFGVTSFSFVVLPYTSQAQENPVTLVEAVIPDQMTFMNIVAAAQNGEGDLTRYMMTAQTSDRASFKQEFSYGRCGTYLREQIRKELSNKAVLREANKLLTEFPGTLELEFDYMNNAKPYFFKGSNIYRWADRKGVVHRIPDVSPEMENGYTGELFRATLTYTYDSKGATGKFDLNSVVPIDPLQILYVKLTDRQNNVQPQNDFTIGLHFIGVADSCYLDLDRSISREIKGITKKLEKQSQAQK